jgi:hypothetical protein
VIAYSPPPLGDFQYGPRPYIFHGPRRQLLHVPTRTKQVPTPKRSFGDQRQTGPAVALGHLILSPSRQSWSRGERFQLSGYTATSSY